MLSADQIGDLAKQILASLPEGSEDVRKHLHAVLVNRLQSLDLVTREEFDIQSRLLQRSREKLEQLERRLAELEKQQQVK